MKKDVENLLLSLKPEEKIKIKNIIDKSKLAKKKNTLIWTDFLDPYEQNTVNKILNGLQINYKVQGIEDGDERKLILIYPEYFNDNELEVPIDLIKIENRFKASKISHKDYLGSILGLGLKREKIGNIYTGEDKTVISVKSEISNYIILNLEKIGRESVNVSKIDSLDNIELVEKFKDLNIIITSLRLDNMVSKISGLSREKSKKMIQNELVKINWNTIKNPSHEIDIEDILSIRKYGRFIVSEISGITKKGNLKLKIKKYI